jgi:hypothetical protein
LRGGARAAARQAPKGAFWRDAAAAGSIYRIDIRMQGEAETVFFDV